MKMNSCYSKTEHFVAFYLAHSASFVLIFYTLGTAKYGYSFVRITALMLSSDRLWVGTGNGVILSIPLVAAKPTRAANNSASTSHEGNQVSVGVPQREKTGFMPYCSMVCEYSLSYLDFDCILLKCV